MDKIKAMFTDLKDTTAEYTPEEIQSGKAMAILSYIGILCLIPYFAEKNNRYVRFHAIQGLNLFLISLIISVGVGVLVFVGALFAIIPVLGWIIAIVVEIAAFLIPIIPTVSSIMGIVFAFQDKAKEVPVVNQIKLIKQ